MHIFLVGPPGIGKSTVAPLLQRALGAAATLDLDDAIEKRAGLSPKTLIERHGWERFRDVESECLHALASTPAWVVVATGGGVVERAANRARMRELGPLIGLKGSLATVVRGITETMGKRPFADITPRRRAADTLRRRAAAYRDVDASFAVDRRTPQHIAAEIAAWLISAHGVRIDVGGTHPYPVLIRAGLLDHVGPHLSDLGWSGKVAVVCDATIARRAAPAVTRSLERSGLDVTIVRVPTGERAKTANALRRLWSELAAAKLGRDSAIVALGGGAVGDLAGFAAATYLRGIRVAQVPTTLLAMVDSSIGGKTGIDLPEGKNLAGAFHPPDAVLADPSVLATLPARQVSSGLAEVVKSAFLADRASVSQLRSSLPRVRAGDLGPTVASIALAAQVKADVVSSDEREKGLREVLNYGHTMGHAYESASGYRVTHGEAVSIGLVFATALAEALRLCPRTLRADLEELLVAAGLPIRARLPAKAWSLLAVDKKVRAGTVRWILPRRVGRLSEVRDVPAGALRAAARVVEGPK
ncbi:MAG: 3-dehydroquinate synthase [Chloroflexi bacterium]|nr:3-dehydroquinate synthase [Chloroflexota bacterium]